MPHLLAFTTPQSGVRHCPWRSCRTRPALSLVEMVVSIVLVSVTLVAALNMVGASKMGQRKIQDRSQGCQLAQALMAEILQQPYADESQIDNLMSVILVGGAAVSQTLGPEFLETDGTRRKFDDVDDYHGWSASPPQAKDGTVMTELAGWRRSVTVEFVKKDDASATRAQDEGAKRITVAVVRNNVSVATLVALRTLGPPPTELCCLPGGSKMDMLAASCTVLGGTPGGPGSNTLNTSCANGLGPVAYWKFDEGSGALAGDSARDHHGAITGATWIGGYSGQALRFRGEDYNWYVTVPDHNDLDLTDKLTITAWVYWDSADDREDGSILTKGTGSSRNYTLGTRGNGREVTFWFYNGSTNEVRSGKYVQDRQWSFVAVSADGPNYTFLIDGNTATKSNSTSRLANSQSLRIGRGKDLDEGWCGYIDELRIYDEALTLEQMTAIMNGQEP